MVGGQYSRDSSWEAGNNPADATADLGENDKVTLKLTTKLTDRHEIFVNTHLEDWAFIGGSSPNVTASGTFVERGSDSLSAPTRRVAR